MEQKTGAQYEEIEALYAGLKSMMEYDLAARLGVRPSFIRGFRDHFPALLSERYELDIPSKNVVHPPEDIVRVALIAVLTQVDRYHPQEQHSLTELQEQFSDRETYMTLLLDNIDAVKRRLFPRYLPQKKLGEYLTPGKFRKYIDTLLNRYDSDYTVAEYIIGVDHTTLREWAQQGLLGAHGLNQENLRHYKKFYQDAIERALVIQALISNGYNLEKIKESLEEVTYPLEWAFEEVLRYFFKQELVVFPKRGQS